MRLISILAGIVGLLSCCNTRKESIRILTAGIAHESNSFNTRMTLEENFNVLRGKAVLENQAWAEYLESEGVEIIPIFHAHAGPYGTVAKPVYIKFKDEILQGIKNAGRLDGIYLEMHGALNVEG